MARIGAADAGYGPVAPMIKPRQAIGSNVLGAATAPKTTAPTITSPGGGGTSTTTTITPLQTYQGDILSDPQAVGAQGIFNAQSSNLAAARADAIQRAVIGAGWTPSLGGALSGYAGDVTPQTLASAAANPMSQKAQLDLQLSQANQNLPYDLAASGAGRSGANAIQQSGLQRQYQTASYQGQQDLLNSIYGAANTYAGSYNDAMNQLMNAREAVAYRLAQSPGYSQSITTDDGTGGAGGGAVDTSGSNWSVPGYDVPAAGSPYGSYAGSPAGVGSTQQAVQRVISAIKQPNPRAGQTLRNVMAG